MKVFTLVYRRYDKKQLLRIVVEATDKTAVRDMLPPQAMDYWVFPGLV